MLLEWKKEYSVKVKEIDSQHKELIRIINQLYDDIYAGKPKKNLEEILNKLEEYTHIHFSTEERYFDRFKYEKNIEHKNIHNDFKEKIKILNQRFKHDGKNVSTELIDFLEDWLLNHIMDEDHKYIECFKKNGLK